MTLKITPALLAEIRKRAEAATPGPWYPRATDDDSYMNARYISIEESPKGFMHDGRCGMGEDCEPEKVIAVTLLQRPAFATIGSDGLNGDHDAWRWDENTEHIARADPTTVLALVEEIERYADAIATADTLIHELALRREGGANLTDEALSEAIAEWAASDVRHEALELDEETP